MKNLYEKINEIGNFKYQNYEFIITYDEVVEVWKNNTFHCYIRKIEKINRFNKKFIIEYNHIENIVDGEIRKKKINKILKQLS